MTSWHQHQLESALICVKEGTKRPVTARSNVPVAQNASRKGIQVVRARYAKVPAHIFWRPDDRFVQIREVNGPRIEHYTRSGQCQEPVCDSIEYGMLVTHAGASDLS